MLWLNSANRTDVVLAWKSPLEVPEVPQDAHRLKGRGVLNRETRGGEGFVEVLALVLPGGQNHPAECQCAGVAGSARLTGACGVFDGQIGFPQIAEAVSELPEQFGLIEVREPRRVLVTISPPRCASASRSARTAPASSPRFARARAS